MESGVLLPIATRPLSRGAIMGGKALALAVVVCIYAAMTSAAEFAVVRWLTGYLPPHPAQAIGYLCVLALVMLVLALAISTRLSAIASSIVAIMFFGIAWIGGIAGSVGDFFGNQTMRDAGTITQLVLPTDAMWRAAVFRLEPTSLTAGLSNGGHGWPGPFVVLSPPPIAMLFWTLEWIVVLYVVAARSFALRDL
jgi:ABC-type transport system involved in multi-copper enzyme maturation permease subunit